VGKSEGKRPLGRPRHRREDGTRTDLRETGSGSRLDPDGSRYAPVAGGKYGDEISVLAPRN
jgi:hypothetical protein